MIFVLDIFSRLIWSETVLLLIFYLHLFTRYRLRTFAVYTFTWRSRRTWQWWWWRWRWWWWWWSSSSNNISMCRWPWRVIEKLFVPWGGKKPARDSFQVLLGYSIPFTGGSEVIDVWLLWFCWRSCTRFDFDVVFVTIVPVAVVVVGFSIPVLVPVPVVFFDTVVVAVVASFMLGG